MPALTAVEVQQARPGRYTTLVELKAGGQGSVFRGTVAGGQEVPEGTDVALKVYHADQVDERAEREVAALRRIQVPSLVRLVGTVRLEIRNQSCICLETAFIEGICLAPRLQRGVMTVAEIAAMARDVALAIDAIWSDRIVHRDIKPDNIMVTPSGGAVLIDLGVARHTSLDALTTYGKTWGTDGYLSPEQAQARRALTCKSDVFALGIVVQEALLGRHPTGGRQSALVATGGPSTNGLRGGLSPEFTGLVDRMVNREPVLRPLPMAVVESMRQFANP